MKRFLLVFLVFNSAVIAMDRIAAIHLSEQQAELSRKNDLAQRLYQELYEVVLAMRRNINKDFPANSLNLIKDLVARGANPNYIPEYGDSLLNLAVETENIELIKLFILQGADVNKKDRAENVPLYNYINYNYLNFGNRNLEIVKLLIENGANPDTQNDAGETVLMLAADTGLVDVVRLLLEGMFIKKQKEIEQLKNAPANYLGLLPAELLQATSEYLKVRANPNIKNKKGNTALSQVIKTLERFVSNPNPLGPDEQGLIRNYEEIINILEPVTAKEQPQPAKPRSWWQRWWTSL